MKVVPFIAESATEAVAQIRAQLGPQAVVLNVRQLEPGGLARLWQKRRIEVIACLPEAGESAVMTAPGPTTNPILEQANAWLAAVDAAHEPSERGQPCPRVPDKYPNSRHKVAPQFEAAHEPSVGPDPVGRVTSVRATDGAPESPRSPDGAHGSEAPYLARNHFVTSELRPPAGITQDPPSSSHWHYHGWRIGAILESTGMMPRFVQKVVERLQAQHGPQRPESLTEEIHLARGVLRQAWPSAPVVDTAPPATSHVFVGAPGVGTTSCLCKWLAQSVLLENQSTRVWRLNGATANTADFLSVFCEILGVPVERSPLPREASEEGLLLVDLPGVNWRDAAALQTLATQVAELPVPAVHLVFNAAYEMPILLAQVRAFGVLPVTDLSFTHLDEEARWGKLWNFVFGTNYRLRFVCTGQNIPGDFFTATPERLLSQQFA